MIRRLEDKEASPAWVICQEPSIELGRKQWEPLQLKQCNLEKRAFLLEEGIEMLALVHFHGEAPYFPLLNLKLK